MFESPAPHIAISKLPSSCTRRNKMIEDGEGGKEDRVEQVVEEEEKREKEMA